MDQISMFDLMYPTFKTDNPVRLIELFAGVGSQAMALRNLGVPFEHYLMNIVGAMCSRTVYLREITQKKRQ